MEGAVINDPREHIIAEAAKPQGIPTMAEEGISKVLAGETSLGELQRVVDLSSGRHAYAHTSTITTPTETATDILNPNDTGTASDPLDEAFAKHIV